MERKRKRRQRERERNEFDTNRGKRLIKFEKEMR
jgi:hypothetical protein